MNLTQQDIADLKAVLQVARMAAKSATGSQEAENMLGAMARVRRLAGLVSRLEDMAAGRSPKRA